MHWAASTSPIASSPIAKALEAPSNLLEGVAKARTGSARRMAREHHVAAVQTDFTHGLGEALTAAGFDLAGIETGQGMFVLTEKVPYNFGTATQLLTEVPLDMPTGSFRSVYSGFVSARRTGVSTVGHEVGTTNRSG
jgi:hypothetical protein